MGSRTRRPHFWGYGQIARKENNMNCVPSLLQRSRQGASCVVEPLEVRALLSAAWTRVDNFVYPAGGPGTGVDQAIAMAADGAGGVYAVGEGHNASTNQEF